MPVVYENNHSNNDQCSDARAQTGHECKSLMMDEALPTVQRSKTITWRSELLHFSQNTTLHGLKQATGETPFLPRRIIWTCLVLGGFSLFVYQVVMSLLLFISCPVAVNMKINYVNNVTFPAVTICNQNAFRTSQAAKEGWYEDISNIYGLGRHVNKTYRSSIYEHTFMDVLNRTGHEKEHMIVSCRWCGRECLEDSITKTFTNQGVCYTFNANSRPKVATQTGAEHGLRLTLNVEQYEYMPGPGDAAGMKILLHDSTDVPLVKDLGLAIPPGAHAFLGMFLLKVKNLPPPHGQCDDSVTLQYFDRYTSQACSADRQIRIMMDECGCIDITMKFSQTAHLPLCTLNQYFSCILPLLETYRRDTISYPCPVPCNERIYNPSVSYGSISNFQVETLLNDRDLTKLQRRYINARDITHRLNQYYFQRDRSAILKVVNTADSVSAVLRKSYKIINELRRRIDQMLDDIAPRIKFHGDVALYKLWYSIHNEFVRGWAVMDERTFRHVTAGYQETLSAFENLAVRSVKAASDGDNCCVRTILHEIIDTDLLKKQSLAMRALDNITACNESYTNGTPIVDYKVTLPKKRYDDTFINPDMLEYTHAKQSYMQEFSSVTHKYIENIVALRNMSESVLDENYFNRTDFEKHKFKIVAMAKAFNYQKYMLEDRLVTKSETIVNGKRTRFNDSVNSLMAARDALYFVLDNLKDSLESRAQDSWADVYSLVRDAEGYISNSTLTKTELSREFTNISHVTCFQELSIAFSELHSRSRDLTDNLELFRKSYIAVWKTMLEETSLMNFYQKLKSDVMLVSERNVSQEEERSILHHIAHLLNTSSAHVGALAHNTSDLLILLNADFTDIDLNEKRDELNRIFRDLKNQSDLSAVIGTSDNHFLDVFAALKNHLKEYLEGNAINAAFFRENFLQLDVFLRELQIEEIEQQKAYDINKLWSDIGGSLGLFVGASFLTLFEIADILLYTAIRRKLSMRRKTSPNEMTARCFETRM